MPTVPREESMVPETRHENENKTLKKENEQLGRELARATVASEERTSGGKRKRTEPTDRLIEKALPRLPTEIWAEVAAKIHRDDVMAFALTSKQLREAQQQAGRKLVTKLYLRDKFVTLFSVLRNEDCVYSTRDWCAWWIKRFNTTETETKDECMESIINVAAHNGYVDVLENDIPEEKIPLLMNAKICAFAALGGHLEVLKWLRSKGCPWDERACYRAAYGGHLEILKWLRIEGCPWHEKLCCSVGKPNIVRWIDAQSSSP